MFLKKEKFVAASYASRQSKKEVDMILKKISAIDVPKLNYHDL